MSQPMEDAVVYAARRVLETGKAYTVAIKPDGGYGPVLLEMPDNLETMAELGYSTLIRVSKLTLRKS